ncbi:TetR family transcriptional regulator [Micromonosporaceae bacterium Da 78-11]
MAVRELRKRDTWRLVHSSALRLMTERGFDAVSVDDIVAAAGISRRTFFNYFAGKESVVFDPDPDDPALWAALTSARPAGEPLWTSLRAVLLGYTAATADRMILQRRVRLASPSLQGCAREVGDRFWDFTRDWAGTLGDHRDLRLDLTVNAARTVLTTVCPHWDVETGITGLHALISESFDLLQSEEWTTS